MIYGRYRRSRNASWQTLIDFGVCRLPVMPLEICTAAGIWVYNDSDVHILTDKESGLSFCENGIFRIVVDDTDPLQRRRFTIAHELGHIFLGHVLVDTPRGRTFDISKPAIETEADVFAARLLAPACVLWGLDLHTAEDISRVCNISMKAARIRAERMEELYKRGKFLTSPLERKVYEQFEKFISSNKNRRKM